MGPEAKFYNYFKKNTPNISYTRIENTSSLGTPDVLAYNKKGTFFTIEFKGDFPEPNHFPQNVLSFTDISIFWYNGSNIMSFFLHCKWHFCGKVSK